MGNRCLSVVKPELKSLLEKHDEQRVSIQDQQQKIQESLSCGIMGSPEKLTRGGRASVFPLPTKLGPKHVDMA